MSSDTDTSNVASVSSVNAERGASSYSTLFGDQPEAAIEKSTLGEWAASVIRLALVVFSGAMYLLVVDPAGTVPWLAYTILGAAGTYSAILLVFEPYHRFDFLTSSIFVSLTDTTLVILWIYATGGFASAFYPLLYASVTAFSFRYGAWEALVGATLHGGAYAALLYATGELAPNLADATIRIGFVFLLAALGALYSIVAHRQTVDKEQYKHLAQRLEDANQEVEAYARKLEEKSRTLDRRRAELARSNEDLERFASVISHDVREPLRTISSYIDLIETRGADTLDPEMQELLAYARDGAERLDAMVRGLHAYSQVDRKGAPLAPLDLGDALDDAMANLSARIEETGTRIEIDPEPLPTVLGDRQQLALVFQNLLANAIRYSGDGPPSIHISATRERDRWVVSVADEGIGIPKDEQQRIFDIFSQGGSAKDGAGEGLGLAMCERIIERHGGKIQVDSKPGEGATFSFTVDSAEDA